MIYQFTNEQLVHILHSTCAAYAEYRDLHEYPPLEARSAAIGEILDAMAAEIESIANGVNVEQSFTPIYPDDSQT